MINEIFVMNNLLFMEIFTLIYEYPCHSDFTGNGGGGSKGLDPFSGSEFRL